MNDRLATIVRKARVKVERELGVSSVTAADLVAEFLGDVLGDLLVDRIKASGVPYARVGYKPKLSKTAPRILQETTS